MSLANSREWTKERTQGLDWLDQRMIPAQTAEAQALAHELAERIPSP